MTSIIPLFVNFKDWILKMLTVKVTVEFYYKNAKVVAYVGRPYDVIRLYLFFQYSNETF